MASGNGDISGLKEEIATSPASSAEGVKVDTAGGGDAFNTTTSSNESAEPLKIPPEQRSADYQKLIQCGLAEKVAAKLDDIYNTGKLSHSDLDERALDALKEFPVDGALTVLKQFLDSNLEHVSNKSAYLCGVMKTYRQKSRSGQTSGVPPAQSPTKGPDEAKIKEILERTGYSLDVTTGQRKYGGPPPGWEGEPPGNGCEVFCGKIPKDMYEDELIPLFEKCGGIWDLRLMMDPMTGLNRGYAFVTFKNREGAQEAVRQLNGMRVREGIRLTVNWPRCRIFVGNIPKAKSKKQLQEEFKRRTPGLTEVIIYSSPDDRKKNRGFCFLEYESHKAASLAKRRLGTSRVKVWGCDIIVDWADPQEEPDDETMSKVKVLYVRNLTQEVTEEKLKESFEAHGKVERVKKIKDYAFVHFEERDGAIKAMDELNGKDVGGSNIEISLAKPPSDKKKKEEILRARERRMMQMMATRPPPYDAPLLPPQLVGRAGRGGMRGGPMGRSDFGFPLSHAGFGDVGNLAPYNNGGYFRSSAARSPPPYSRSRSGQYHENRNFASTSNNRNYSSHSAMCFGSPSTPLIGARTPPAQTGRARRSLSRGGMVGGSGGGSFSSSSGSGTRMGGRGHGGMSHGRGQPPQGTGQQRGDGLMAVARPGTAPEELRGGPLPSGTLLEGLQPQFPGLGTPLGGRAVASERATAGEVQNNGHPNNLGPKANFQQKTNANAEFGPSGGGSGVGGGGGTIGLFDSFL